jgi:hypothetical protein
MTSVQDGEFVQEEAPPQSLAEVNPLADRIAAAMSKAGLGIRERGGVADLRKMDQAAN